MKYLLGAFMIFMGVIMIFVPIVKAILFDINCGNRMERAGNANTVEMATEEMEVVVKYLEKSGLTEGYTSVFYNTPDEDLGYFYNNMRSSLNELKSIKPEATQLEKSNLLMKLRETLIKSGEKGQYVDTPEGISRYPHNAFYGIMLFLGVFLLFAGCLVMYIALEERR
jgi:hypothetical protein